ncbi:MAG: DNA polymerase III subunit delta [Pleurocapsa sp.]
MPVYFYWGEDDFAIAKAVERLQSKVLDPNWLQFNYHKLTGDRAENIIEGLNQVITPVFGLGERLVWLDNTNICQQCSQDTLTELERTLAIIPTSSHLLLTSNKKPDGRLKSTKLIKKYAIVQNFDLILPWETELIERQVTDLAAQIGVKLNQKGRQLLAESVGNNTRQLWNELEKLAIYSSDRNTVLDETAIATLVVCHTQNSLQLATAIKEGKTQEALGLVTDLINRNEPALRIIATLVGQFRAWTIVKLMQAAGEKDNKAIAAAAGINNPNRIYYLTKEINRVSTEQLLAALPVMLDLEYRLKRSADSLSTLQTKIIELCCLFQKSKLDNSNWNRTAI